MSDRPGPIDMTEVMKIVDNDKDLLIECFDEFLDSLPQSLSEISQAIDQGDSSGLDKASHRLKGSLKYMAAPTAHDIAYQLEIMGKEENLNLANDTFHILCKECEEIKEFMEQYKLEN